jgi:hypothetical protein
MPYFGNGSVVPYFGDASGMPMLVDRSEPSFGNTSDMPREDNEHFGIGSFFRLE